MSLFIEHEKRMVIIYSNWMLDSIRECMPCRFHVDLDDVHRTLGTSETFHEAMTYVESHETSKGVLEVFHTPVPSSYKT